MRSATIGIAMVVLAGMTAPAVARDENGYRAIAAGDYAGAMVRLESELRMFPDAPEVALNLAFTYLHAGRVADARILYADVMKRPEVTMDLPSGRSASSHAIAARGLSLMPRTIASR